LPEASEYREKPLAFAFNKRPCRAAAVHQKGGHREDLQVPLFSTPPHHARNLHETTVVEAVCDVEPDLQGHPIHPGAGIGVAGGGGAKLRSTPGIARPRVRHAEAVAIVPLIPGGRESHLDGPAQKFTRLYGFSHCRKYIGRQTRDAPTPRFHNNGWKSRSKTFKVTR